MLHVHATGSSPRSSSISTIVPPISAASILTLFEEFGAGLLPGPRAESTAHKTGTKPHQDGLLHHPCPNKIVSQPTYISNLEVVIYLRTLASNQLILSTISSFTPWSFRAVRSLIPNTSMLQRKMSTVTSGTKFGGCLQHDYLRFVRAPLLNRTIKVK
jgi:hypothetical protein